MAGTVAQRQETFSFSAPVIDLSNYDLNKEIDRIKTFTDNNWKNKNVEYKELALLGCYFSRKPDIVKCQFCFVELREFVQNDKVLNEHLRFSPNCPLLRRRQTSNEPLSGETLDKVLPKASYDECGITRRRFSRAEEDVTYPNFRLLTQRMKSFATWPVGLAQKPEQLATAGFFYSGQSDYTICFSCGVYVGNWEPQDNPWVEHKKLLVKDCNFLKLNNEQLKSNELKYELSQKGQKKEQASKDEGDSSPKVDFEGLCKICLNNKSSVVILPCKHVAVCGACIFGIKDTCPICRTPIQETISLFFS